MMLLSRTPGDDTLVGSDFSETLIGGTGADRITGGLGVDVFVSPDYPQTANEVVGGVPVIDTLAETRDADFTLSDASVTIGTETEVLGGIFENVEFTGGDKSNTFTLSGWTRNGLLNGAEGGDIYDITIAPSGVGLNLVKTADTGVSGIDSMIFRGSGATISFNWIRSIYATRTRRGPLPPIGGRVTGTTGTAC